jgi:hypothetical protein|tara:strand:- start:490 stop:696 length:207 start_codon:yes stop_codon:yes gene_type:complete
VAKGNGQDIQDDKILTDVEMVYALAKIKHFKDMVQRLPIKTFSQEDFFDVVDAIFEDIFNPLTDKEKQ